MLIVQTYGTYLFLTLALTVWVARTLHVNGRAFLVDAFAGNEELADSVNHLLVVGFYLINLGYVSLNLETGLYPDSLAMSIELLATKIGHVAIVLGLMHFANLYIFSSMRRRALIESDGPPVCASAVIESGK